jgi:mRNA-degrading endonuclease RelE of RelBE toxin-antitoxin system
MRFRVEVSKEAEKQLSKFPRKVRDRLVEAIDEFEQKDDSQWSNIKALKGPEWKGRLRKRAGNYRIIFTKSPDRGIVEISAILIRSKSTYG